MRLFVVPQCNNETVSIAQEYLDRAPESVLAIAAQRAPPENTISLKDWPDANVAVLQVGTRVALQQKLCICLAPEGSHTQLADKLA